MSDPHTPMTAWSLKNEEEEEEKKRYNLATGVVI